MGEALLKVISSNGFTVNDGKTRLQPRSSRQEVTGLIVNERVNVDRRFIRQIRAMLHALDRYGLEACQSKLPEKYTKDRHPTADPQFEDVLHGKIAYLGMVRGKQDVLYQRFRRQYKNLMNDKPINEGVERRAPGRPAVDNNPIRLLHLSDFHFKDSTAWDANPLLDKLVASIHELEGVDAVVVTGDVAHSGKEKEYKTAEAWFLNRLLPAARVGRKAVYFVPGNHDCDRDTVVNMVRLWQDSVRQPGKADEIQRAFQSGVEGPMIFERFKEYLAFVGRVRDEDPATRPWWVHSVMKAGVNVRLLGLCSAWMSCEKEEQGRLLVGLPQVSGLVGTEGDVNIALMHHPNLYFHESDAAAWQEISNWAHVVLRGHLHRESAAEIKDHHNHLLVLAAGSAYQGSEYRNGFQVVEVYPYDRKCRVTPFVWHEDHRRWQRSRDVFPKSEDGVGTFDFGANRRDGA